MYLSVFLPFQASFHGLDLNVFFRQPSVGLRRNITMARETIKCPHCECKVLLSEVEKEDGLCPECGQLVLSSNLFDEFDDEEDLELDEIEEENFDDDLDDEEDDEEEEFEEEDDFEEDPAIHRQSPFRKRKKNFE